MISKKQRFWMQTMKISEVAIHPSGVSTSVILEAARQGKGKGEARKRQGTGRGREGKKETKKQVGGK